MYTLSPAERSALRAKAHALNPVVLISEEGLKPSLIKEIDMNLHAHELIKIRVFGDDREKRLAIYETLCTELGAAPVQHIGKLLVIYRPAAEAAAATTPASLRSIPVRRAGKGLREVTIVKPSPSGTKKPTVTKVVLKGNERVTAGGNVKRVKPRQKSSKKRSLA